MRELALFAGAGGGILGGILLGWTTVCAVELDDYCQRVLKQRQEDGHLPRFPIHGDVKAFDGDEWSGRVDVITAGFPCQPFSVAGKQRGEADERNLWPETIRVIREVGPRFAFLENVPGLLAHPYFGTILGELAEAGFNAEWTVLGADDCGAPHRRKRLWILAYANEIGRGFFGREQKGCAPGKQLQSRDQSGSGRTGAFIRGGFLSHPQRNELRHEPRRRSGSSGTGAAQPGHDGSEESLADADRGRRKGERGGGLLDRERAAQWDDADGCGGEIPDASQQGRQGRSISGGVQAEHPIIGDSCWWQSEPNVGRVADGVASRVDRLRAIGNGQVPIVAATAFLELRRRLEL